jgi:hypothetical protein
MYQATISDIQALLFFHTDMWSHLYNGNLFNWGNSSAVENNYRNLSVIDPIWRGNNHSKLPGGASPSWPVSPPFHDATDDYYNRTFYIPSGAHPPGSSSVIGDISEESHMCILQPNGWWLNVYATVVCANGDIICMLGSYLDTHGLGDGYTNGRRAPSLMSGAGVVRQGEFTAGVIKHKLAINLPGAQLKASAVNYPAVTIDTNTSNYAGNIPNGALLALPTDYDIDGHSLTANQKILAQCLKDYGAIVVDRGGGGCMFYCEDGATDIPSISIPAGIKDYIMYVDNITQGNPTGGGTERQPRLPV